MTSFVLEHIGWSRFFEDQFNALGIADAAPYRVVIEYQDRYRLLGRDGYVTAFTSGALLREANRDRLKRPAVGDWVAARVSDDGNATIVHLLERRTRFIRQAAGRKLLPQVIAANIDAVFIVTACNQDFNLRRLERYLTTVENSGARPVIVLHKSDLVPDPGSYRAQIATVAAGVPVITSSAVTHTGMDAIRAHIAPAETVALVGSSGVGKSTIINCLLGEDQQEVGEIRERDGRGRHTTTHRELIIMPTGGVLIDTPGMRELKLWSPGEALVQAFPDIAELAASCRFRDCTHGSEPGCAVNEALAAGTLDRSRFDNYLELCRAEQAQSARGTARQSHVPPSTRRYPRQKGGRRRP